MPHLILSIDTATPLGGVCLAEEGRPLEVRANPNQADHAAWVHTAIQDLLKSTGKKLSQLAAVAVTEGPGSYTGLRVGMATAKGLCYALQIPLIAESTLRVMAHGIREQMQAQPAYAGGPEEAVFLAPMIDARRMEVFTAVFSVTLDEVAPPAAMVLEPDAFAPFLRKGRVIFAGSGSPKWRNICHHPHAVFAEAPPPVASLAILAEQRFKQQAFRELAYAEPAYLKSVYVVPAK